MHELGHALGLDHGGGDPVNFKPNYLSVMSYAFQTCQVPSAPAPAVLPGACDYSRDDLNDLVEPFPPGLDECQGLDAGLYGLGPADWDADTAIEGVTNCQPPNNGNVSVDINSDSQLTTLRGFDDWDNIFFAFRTLDNFANGVGTPVADEADRQTVERARAVLADLLAPNLTVLKTGPTDALPGDAIAYAVTVANPGRGPALGVRLDDALPDGSVSSFPLGTVTVGSSHPRTVPFAVPCATPDGAVLTDTATATGKNIVGDPVTGHGAFATTIHAPVLTLAKSATGAVNAGEAITYVLTYENTGSADAVGAVLTDTLPVGVYYSRALDAGSGPAPTTVVTNADGTITLTWAIGTVAAGSGPLTISYTARPSLLFLGGQSVTNHASLTFTNANGCTYPPVTAASPTTITVVAPSRDPQGLGFWRNHPELLTAEILARVQATDIRFDGADGSLPDGALSVAECNAVLVPGGNMDKVLEEQLLATYLNLASRRINAGTVISSPLARRLGLDNVKEAAEYAIGTLVLPVTGNRERYSDATTVLDQINNNRSEVY